MPMQPLAKGMLAVALAGSGAPAMAQSVTTLAVDARVLGSSNPFLIPGSNRGAVLSQISLSPEWKLTGPTGSGIDLYGTVTQKWFSQRYGNFLVGNFSAAGTYRDSEYLTVQATGGFSRDLAVDVLTTSIDAVADPQSLRTTYTGQLLVKWSPDAHTDIQPEISYEKADYEGTTLLRNTQMIRFSLAAGRKISARTEIGLRGEVILNKAAGTPEANSQGIYATLKQDITEHWQLSAEVGAQRNDGRVELLPDATVNQPSRTTFSGRAELCRKAPLGLACLTGVVDTEVSGLGGLQRTLTGTALVKQRLTRRASVEASIEYRHSSTQNGAFPTLDALHATAKLDRTMGNTLTLSGMVQYLRRRTSDGGWIGAAYGGLELRYQPRLHD